MAEAAASSGATSAGAATTRAGAPGAEFVFTGRELRFSCVRVARHGPRLRLLGGSYSVEVRCAVSTSSANAVPDGTTVREAAEAECARLADGVLLPDGSIGSSLVVANDRVTLTSEDGSQIALPEGDVIRIPTQQVTPGDLACVILDRVVAGIATEVRCTVHWLEVRVTDSLGATTGYRRVLTDAAPCSVAALAQDW
eukprot:NODE_20331_length_803_cov_2.890533.p2 GENE.NODE_20331_length_803_cov_2.890533~~NODE_20331_length_803_cov_2.890533.p2  ORF type:complete len:197 (-),score=51.21 NODE_20331_length_803_cov_2.890533:211-801(-)